MNAFVAKAARAYSLRSTGASSQVNYTHIDKVMGEEPSRLLRVGLQDQDLNKLFTDQKVRWRSKVDRYRLP